MALDPTNEQNLVLRREVIEPQQHNMGVGVMLVASASVFFAVASSAFILRSQMQQRRCLHRSRPAPAKVVPAKTTVATPKATPCGEALFERSADGSVSIYYVLCASDDR